MKKFLQMSMEFFVLYSLCTKFIGKIYIKKNIFDIDNTKSNTNHFFSNYSIVICSKINLKSILNSKTRQTVLIKNPHGNNLVLQNVIGFNDDWVKSSVDNIYYKVNLNSVWSENFNNNCDSEVCEDSNKYGPVRKNS